MTKFEKAIKELRWLQFNFPWQDNPENDADKMTNAIHKYTGDAIELLESQQWISVKDRLPDTSIEYIVCAIDEDGEQFVTSDHWLDTVRHWYLFDEHADSVVTHWMPLPEPPKEKNNEGKD